MNAYTVELTLTCIVVIHFRVEHPHLLLIHIRLIIETGNMVQGKLVGHLIVELPCFLYIVLTPTGHEFVTLCEQVFVILSIIGIIYWSPYRESLRLVK